MAALVEAFEFATAARIVFGRGTVHQVGSIAHSFGSKAFLVCGARESSRASVIESLTAAGVTSTVFQVTAEPTTAVLTAALKAAREASCDLVVAFGGGSVIDVGKATAALLTNGGEVLDYLEVVGRAQPLKKASAPCIAIPTTAGTGAEVTKNSVLCSPENNVKVSVRGDCILPRVAIIDPELTLTLPRSVTRNTGLDALTQCIEPFVSVKANPFTDALCREGMTRAARSLRRACEEPSCIEAREDMCVASLLGGISLANAKLGAVHGFAGPLGGMLQAAPHGALCAAVLPHVVKANVAALQRLAAINAPHAAESLERYREVACILTGRKDAAACDAAAALLELCRALQVPGLASYGMTEERVPELVAKVSKASSTKGNPVVLSAEELTEIAKLSL